MPAPEAIPHDEMVRARRRLHASPELSMVEFDTARFVAETLGTYGLDEVRTKIGKTGVLGTLVGGRPGPVTLLRADMDALPIREINAVDYVSTRDGVMHACGHDGHVAILLAAAKTLAERRSEVAGTLVFCFQPGEEGAAGNRFMIEDGALENPHVDRTFALHLYSGLDVGKIGVRDGAFFASADEFTLTIRGRGGHGAMPHNSIDPIVAGAHIVTMLQTIVSREVAPKDPAVFTVGQFTSGTTFNVIPDEALPQGDGAGLRRRGPGKHARPPARASPAAWRGAAGRDRGRLPLVVPADRQRGRAERRRPGASAARLLGPENVVEHDIVMWAEDMSFMQELRPGAYFIVGSRGGEASSFPAPQRPLRYRRAFLRRRLSNDGQFRIWFLNIDLCIVTEWVHMA